MNKNQEALIKIIQICKAEYKHSKRLPRSIGWIYEALVEASLYDELLRNQLEKKDTLAYHNA